MLCKKVQFETSWLISIYFTYLQRSLANAARHQPELQQDVSSTHSLISSAGPHMWLDGEHLPGRIDVNDSVKKMELELKQISHLQFLQFICAPWSGQPNPLRRMLCQPKPLRTAYLRQPNEDQDKHALVRLAQISNLRLTKHGSRLYDKHDLIEYIEMPSKSESVNLLHLSYRDNQGRNWGILVFSCFDFLKVKTWQNLVFKFTFLNLFFGLFLWVKPQGKILVFF